jgi:DNA gyrase subunit B
MAYRTPSGITIIEGLEAVRRRPALYIGESTPARLVEVTLDGVATDVLAPSAVRLIRWDGGAFTIAFDGAPLPIDPFALPVDAVPHPELYQYFMTLRAPSGGLASAGPVLNALSEQLVVSTMKGVQRYRAVFSRGSLVSLLSKTSCDAVLGSRWLTFVPDASVVAGSVSLTEAGEIVRRVALRTPTVTFEDRSSDSAAWY